MPTAKKDHEAIVAYLKEKNVKIPENSPFPTAPNTVSYAPTTPNYVYNIVVDSDHPDAGFIVVEDDGGLSIYMPEGYVFKGLRTGTITELIQQGHKRFALAYGVNFSHDPNAQRTCLWYSPGQDHVRDFGAEMSEKYEFDRPQSLGTCSHPDMIAKYSIPNPICEVDGRQATCGIYEQDTWKLERKAKLTLEDGSNVTLYVETARYGAGIRHYRILRATEGSDIPVLLDTLTSEEHKNETSNVLNEMFFARLQELQPSSTELLDISTLEDETEDRKYFNYVLAK